MNSIKYCNNCAVTKANMKGARSKEISDYGAGYLIGYGNNINHCPFCNTLLTNVSISDDDFLCLRKVSNCDRELLKAMIKLHDTDIIEYNLKMSQFRAQVEQQKQAENNVPKCPTCGSTNLKKISGISKAGSVALWGIFAAGKVSKQWHCNKCGSDF